MSETGPKEINNSEIVQEQGKDSIPKEITIEEALQESLPDDISKQHLFLEIFNQPTFNNLPPQSTNNELSQTNIIEYIKSGRLFGNSRSISRMNFLEEKTNFIIEDMDKYFKSTGSIKTIKTYNNTLDEALTTKDEALTTKDEALTTKDEALTTKDKTLSDNTKQIEIKNTLLESRKATKESYDKLDKTKYPEPTAEEISQGKTQINKETQQKLEANGLSAEEYAKFLIIEKNYEKDLRKEGNTEFLNNLKELKEDLGDETTLKNTLEPENTDKLINGNQNLKDYANNSSNLDAITKPTLPEIKDFDEEFATYVKFIPDKDLQQRIMENENIIKIYDKEDDDEKMRDEKGEKAYEEYMTAIDAIKEILPARTQEIIKQRVLGSCITGLASYFDNSQIEEENFASNFDINTQEGFTIKDDILAINGDIKDNNIGFYYNLADPDAPLQSDDYLHFDTASETFAFGVDGGGKNDLGIKLPTISMLSSQAQAVSEMNFAEALEKSTSMEELETTIKEQISKELLKNYRQEALVKTRVERDIEKNITAQSLQSEFVPDVVLMELNRDRMTNKTTEKKAWKIMEIRNTSTENMRSDELRRFRSLIDRLDPIIAREDQGNLEPKRQKILEGIDEERGAISYDDQRGKETLKFFKRFSKDGEMNLDDLKAFIDGLEKKESVTENMNEYSPDFQTEEDHDGADELLNSL